MASVLDFNMIYPAFAIVWLRAEWQSDWSSSPVAGNIILLSNSSRPALGTAHTSVQWAAGDFSYWIKWPELEAHH
jgi:hypothetical protein